MIAVRRGATTAYPCEAVDRIALLAIGATG
jgi:hypothetical protein